MTELLFRDDPYLSESAANVIEAAPGRIVLDATVFYARGGGQPGDRGELILADGSPVAIADAVYDADRKTIAHVASEGARLPAAGDRVTARIDWDLRYRRMRAHTALHLLSVVLPWPVTGGSVGDGDGRLDFDSGEAAFDKADIESRLNALVATNADVTTLWISDEELAANPGLVKTMKVKPPTGSGRVRLVEIAGLDLQPCGGTHVARLGEIGRVTVSGIEKKGKINRRVRIVVGGA
jgi:misacylated tRNA(Ala) deacylase